MDISQRTVAVVLVYLVLGSPSGVLAQDAPPVDPGPTVGADAAPPDAQSMAPAPSEAPTSAAPSSAQSAEATRAPGPDLSVHAATSETISEPQTDVVAPTPADPPNTPADELDVSSHIRRPHLMLDGALLFDGPLSMEVQGREFLQARRQAGGIAMPDTTAALGQGAPGTLPHDRAGVTILGSRQQPSLVLLNGRRLVSAPYFGAGGADYVDLNQLPISLIDRVEIVKGLSTGLYGDGAVSGAVNFVTRRKFNGLEVDAGGQATDDFDQHEEDITLTFGVGDERTGMTTMLSYFTRQPLAATDSDWIGGREARTESLLGSPASFQQLTNFEYPFPDPFCDIAEKAGHSTGLEVRLRGFGPPDQLGQLPDDVQENLRINQDRARGNDDGKVDAYETSTYCAGNFTKDQDLVLKDERIQTYSTFWHKFSDHTEAFGEFGYYRSENENRTAPSFPILRIAPYVFNTTAFVPLSHADQPVYETGFASSMVAHDSRSPANQFIIGRTSGTYAGANKNTRRVDVMRGVLGLRGDLKDVAAGTLAESWDWELSGLYSTSESVSSATDVLMDKLTSAVNSCVAERTDTFGDKVRTTIKERQQAGCYNPFYSSVVNNSAINPLGIKTSKAPSDHGFITSDSDALGEEGHGVQDGGYICDPNDPNSPPCPAEFDRDGDGVFELAGTPNTKQVMDKLTGEQITRHVKTLATTDSVLRGDLASFEGGVLSFGAGAQYRRESLEVDYDSEYNKRLYAFLFGAPDVPNVARNIAAGFAELRLRLLDGLVEVQPAARIEHFDDVGTSFSPLLGLSLRPFASSASPPKALEWLVLRGHVSRGQRAPSLLQMHGSQTEFQSVEYLGVTHFVPHAFAGNPHLDFENYTTVSGGVQWDYVGIHIGADFWTTAMRDLIGGDNSQTLLTDCEAQFDTPMVQQCTEPVHLSTSRTLDHIESQFDNLADVDSNGIDGGASYTLDTKLRGLGDAGTFVLGTQGTFINSYLIKSPRALREYFRTGPNLLPEFRKDGTRDYSKVKAEYEAAGWRNADNFAPPMPRLRFAVPLRWLYEGHMIGVTMRYIGGYNDDSEATVERYGLFPKYDTSKVTKETYGRKVLALATGEAIPAWTVFDLSYGFSFGDEGWKTKLLLGMMNVLDRDPPAVESPLGYEVGIHDPRGRVVYARVTGEF